QAPLSVSIRWTRLRRRQYAHTEPLRLFCAVASTAPLLSSAEWHCPNVQAPPASFRLRRLVFSQAPKLLSQPGLGCHRIPEISVSTGLHETAPPLYQESAKSLTHLQRPRGCNASQRQQADGECPSAQERIQTRNRL